MWVVICLKYWFSSWCRNWQRVMGFWIYLCLVSQTQNIFEHAIWGSQTLGAHIPNAACLQTHSGQTQIVFSILFIKCLYYKINGTLDILENKSVCWRIRLANKSCSVTIWSEEVSFATCPWILRFITSGFHGNQGKQGAYVCTRVCVPVQERKNESVCG